MTRKVEVHPLRIAMLTTFYPPYSFGGDAIGVERLASAIAGRGHNVTVVHDIDAYLTLGGRQPRTVPQQQSAKVIGLRSRFSAIANLLTHQTGRPIVHGRRLREILLSGAFDIIWYHNVSLLGGLGLLSYGDGLKIYEAHEHWLVCPTHVLWRHNRELCDSRQCFRCSLRYRRPPQLWRQRNFVNRQLDYVDAFIAKSEFSKSKHHQFGFTREMKVVPYFLPDKQLSHEDPTEPPHSRPYFLFVGRLEKIKGLTEVIPIFSRFPDTDLLIIGTGDYEWKFRNQAAGMENVIFLGKLGPEELSRYYRSAVALIVPSVCFETFGIILIEAFREGTPVIARNLGPFVEIVNRCGGGMLFSNSDELETAMSRLQSDHVSRSAMSRSARNGFETWWSEKSVLRQYFRTLHEAAVRKGRHELASALEAQVEK